MFATGTGDHHSTALELGDHHSTALELAAILRRPQRHSHFGPFVKGGRAAELNAALVNGNRIGGKFQTGLAALDGDLRFRRINALNFSCTHISESK